MRCCRAYLLLLARHSNPSCANTAKLSQSLPSSVHKNQKNVDACYETTLTLHYHNLFDNEQSSNEKFYQLYATNIWLVASSVSKAPQPSTKLKIWQRTIASASTRTLLACVPQHKNKHASRCYQEACYSELLFFLLFNFEPTKDAVAANVDSLFCTLGSVGFVLYPAKRYY